MIELIRYSQDVPVNGNGGEALSFLVFSCKGKEFRVRVVEQTISDIVQFLETLSNIEEPHEEKHVSEEQEDWVEPYKMVGDPVTRASTALLSEEDDEESVPQL